MKTTGVPLAHFQVIGISAGAHTAGAVGLGFNELYNYTLQIPRITGLIFSCALNDLGCIKYEIMDRSRSIKLLESRWTEY